MNLNYSALIFALFLTIILMKISNISFEYIDANDCVKVKSLMKADKKVCRRY